MQDNFKMAVDVPGVESDKLNIEAEGNVLRIRRAFCVLRCVSAYFVRICLHLALTLRVAAARSRRARWRRART
jgi:hypothetical protein